MYAKYTTFVEKYNLKLPQESNFGSPHLYTQNGYPMHMTHVSISHNA